MKSILLEENLKEFQDFFESIIEAATNIISWQLRDDQSRVIFMSQFLSTDFQKKTFQGKMSDEGEKDLSSGTVYYYVETMHTIFKCEVIEIQEHSFVSKLPLELKALNKKESSSLLDEMKHFVKGHGLGNIVDETTSVRGEGRANQNQATHMRYNSPNTTDHISTKWRISSMSKRDSELFETELSFVSLDEEDELYADQRSAPRARPPKDKKINIEMPGKTDQRNLYPLFDLSQGGLGFIITDKSEFKVDQKLNVLGFDDKEFDTPMVVVIKAIRDVDKEGHQFKVGCAFQG